MSLGHSNPYSGTSSDSSSLVYTKCANQSFTGATEAYHRTLSALYQQLLTESYRSKFFKSTAGDENLGISGLFQCRGDLGNDDCQHCVGGLPETLGSRCGQAVAARVQLSGCYLRYETDGFPEHELWPSEGGGGRSDDYESELLHEKCSSKSDNSSDFKTAREAAFAAVEAQLAKAEVGFCEKEIEHVQVVAQCEGGLGACDCGQCVHAAAEIAEEKCGSSVTGEVYLSKCYLSYSYDSEGQPIKPILYSLINLIH
ncbi:unnamed protein product [Linum trigynum]|uniref:Gnk2-homologous domain-containing protein n=1 Tax=Linum trigynum TaxID=586398 RepID=A0AAV2E9X9_9ROSI